MENTDNNKAKCFKCKKLFNKDSEKISESGLNDNEFICEECASC